MSEDKQAKPFTVKEIKAIEPFADSYQFSKSNRYIVMIKKTELVDKDGVNIAKKRATMIYQLFASADIPVMILVGADDDLTIFEVKP